MWTVHQLSLVGRRRISLRLEAEGLDEALPQQLAGLAGGDDPEHGRQLRIGRIGRIVGIFLEADLVEPAPHLPEAQYWRRLRKPSILKRTSVSYSACAGGAAMPGNGFPSIVGIGRDGQCRQGQQKDQAGQ